MEPWKESPCHQQDKGPTQNCFLFVIYYTVQRLMGHGCWSQTFWTRSNDCRCYHGSASTSFEAKSSTRAAPRCWLVFRAWGFSSVPQTYFSYPTDCYPLVPLQPNCTTTAKVCAPWQRCQQKISLHGFRVVFSETCAGTRSPGKWSRLQACRWSRSIWTMLIDICFNF